MTEQVGLQSLSFQFTIRLTKHVHEAIQAAAHTTMEVALLEEVGPSTAKRDADLLVVDTAY